MIDNDKGTSSCFYKSKKILGRSVKRETLNLRKQRTAKKLIFTTPIWLNIKDY